MRFAIAAVAILCFSLAESATGQTPLIQIGTPGHIESRILGEDRAFWINLPPGYNAEMAYPVIYLLDGDEHLAGLAAVQGYYNQFRLPEMIVVAIDSGENRTRDLTPTVVSDRNGAPVASSGGAAAFRAFLADELIPHIDATYQTTPHRVLIGHSYGGLFVVDTLVEQPDLFRNYVALDPSLDWDEGRWMASALPALTEAALDGHGLFVAVANEIIRFSDVLTFETVRDDDSPFSLNVRSQLTFAETLSGAANGLEFAWETYDRDIHGSVPLVGMRDGLVHLYDFWELKSPALYNDPDTPTETILNLIRAQSAAREAHMGYALPMEEELLDMLAGFYEDIGLTAKAVAVRELIAEYYPDTDAR